MNGSPPLIYNGVTYQWPKSDPWPIWAKTLKQFATPEDKGIGDVVARMIGDENSAKFKAWHLATFGRPCGCNGRQKLWNQKYPLNVKDS